MLLGSLKAAQGKPTGLCLLPSDMHTLHIHIRATGQELWFLGHCIRVHLWPGDKLLIFFLLLLF